MIKNIENGNDRCPQPKYRITCEKCNSIFECEKSDTYEATVGFGSGERVICCPVCNARCTDWSPKWKTINYDEMDKWAWDHADAEGKELINGVRVRNNMYPFE